MERTKPEYTRLMQRQVDGSSTPLYPLPNCKAGTSTKTLVDIVSKQRNNERHAKGSHPRLAIHVCMLVSLRGRVNTTPSTQHHSQ